MAMDDAKAIIQIPGVWKAKYVGRAGWVSMDANVIGDWAEIERLVIDSYRLIAPKRTVAKMDEANAARRGNAKRKKQIAFLPLASARLCPTPAR